MIYLETDPGRYLITHREMILKTSFLSEKFFFSSTVVSVPTSDTKLQDW